MTLLPLADMFMAEVQKELENWVIKDWVNSTPGLWLDMAYTLTIRE